MNSSISDQKGSISWMAQNPVAANLLMILLVVGGLLMSMRLRKEVFPQISIDQISVSVAYPGASPAEVEQGIILAVEESVRSLEGVKEVRSMAAEGMASVIIELEVNSDRDRALSDVKNAVDQITSLPLEAEAPQVRLPELKADAISLVLYGQQDEKVMHQVGEQVRDQLLQLPEVTQVEVEGVRPLEISIEVPQATLRSYGLTLEQIAVQIRKTALELPGGGIKTKDGEILLRTTERRDYGREFADIPIIYGKDAGQLKLGDIAKIHDGFAENDVFAFFNGMPAVLLKVYSVGDQSPTDVGLAVKEFATDLDQNLPPGIMATTWQDRTILFEERVDLLLGNAMIGLVLVLLVLGLFLEPRLAFWVSLGIPISFLGSVILLPAFGVSLNMISMFAFLVTLGMVVDDAIVVGENAYRLRQQGYSYIKAAIIGAKQVSTPVFFSIATTMAAFSPLLFVPGTHGKLSICIPIIVILVLTVSLIESFFVLPAHLGHNKNSNNRRQRFSKGVEHFTHKAFKPFMTKLVNFRWLVVASSIAIFLLAMGLVSGGQVKIIDMPKEETDWVTAKAELAYGVAVEDTRKVMQHLIKTANQTIAENGGSQVSNGILSLIGSSNNFSPFAQTGSISSNSTNVTVAFVPADQRNFSSFGFVDQWRKRVGNLAGVEALSFSSTIMGTQKPLDIELSHHDSQVLEAAAEDVAGQLEEFEGVFDVDNGIERGKPQLDFKISPDGINAGLNVFDLASQVRSAFYGSEALRQQRGRHEVKVIVRRPKDERQSLYDIEEMMIRTPFGGEMPLSQAAIVEHGHAYNTISRTNGKRTLRIQADVEESKANPTEIMSTLKKKVMPDIYQKYPGLEVGSSGRQKEMQDFFSFMLVGFGMALIAIYGLLAIPLKSYLQPLLVVMAAIPFGFVGAVFGHYVMGMDLTMFSILGVVALAGVVINDSIVLVHTANTFKKSGLSAREAVVNATVMRFRPILLTTLTTFGGLAPLIFETSFQARMIVPMAVSLGFGILVSTVFVLLLVPSLYLIVENLRDHKKAVGSLVVIGLLFSLPAQAEITSGPEITLEQALRLAEQRNISMAALEQDIKQAQARLKSSWAVLLPMASASVNYNHNDHADLANMPGGEPIEMRRQEDLSAAIQVSLPIINASSWYGINIAQAQLKLSELNVENARQNLLLSVSQAYFQALTARSLIDIQQAQLLSAKRHFDIASIRQKSGTGKKIDINRAQTELINVKEELLKAYNSFENARDALAVLIGLEELPLPIDNPQLNWRPLAELDLEKRALDNRPDIKAVLASVDLNQKQVNSWWLKFIPSLNAGWQLNHQFSEPVGLSSPDKTRWQIGLSLSVPIFDQVRYADYDGKKAVLEKAKFQAENAQINAKREVRKAFRDYQQTLSLIESATTKASLSSQTLQLAEKAYQSGTGSSLEVTDARRASRAAAIDLAIKKFEAQLNLLGLFRAIGEDIARIAF
jgi:multidrug efflux pump subunit AcrB/outer membrane protein TolC